MTKHFAAWQQRARKARSASKRSDDQVADDASFLWIVSAGAPNRLLAKLRVEHSPDWPSGVYLFGDDVLRVGIVVASELPRDSTTLLIRLMAAGPLLAPAIRELAALPRGAYERVVAEPVLLSFQHVLGQNASRTHDEQEFIMAMQSSWEDARAEGRADGNAVGQANALLTVLRVRGIAVTDGARQRILAQKDQEQMERWLEKAVVASTIADVIDDVK